jgi:hypothetical protein
MIIGNPSFPSLAFLTSFSFRNSLLFSKLYPQTTYTVLADKDPRRVQGDKHKTVYAISRDSERTVVASICE